MAGRLDRERYLREASDRLLEHTLSLGAGDLAAVAGEICQAARTVVPCDWARLYVVDGDSVRLVAGEPRVPALHVGSGFALGDFSDSLVRSRRPVVSTDLGALGLPPGLVRTVRDLDAAGEIVAPLLVGERLTGLLACSWKRAGREPDGEMLGVTQRLADQASAALENARRRSAQDELNDLHDTLEQNLLPPDLRPRHPELSVITRYLPSEGRLRLGGDFLDMMTLPRGGLALIIGDVTGHGPAAAALGATLRAAWQSLVASGADPATVSASLEATLVRERRDQEALATACLAWIDCGDGRDRLRCINIAHPPPLLISGRAVAVPVSPTLPLGLGREARVPPAVFGLTPPWSLLFYTDGLVEGRAAPGSAERFEEHRLLAWLGGHQRVDDALIDRLLADVSAANGGPVRDDVALIAVSRRATRAPTGPQP